MTLILELEPEIERQLELEAARLGVSKTRHIEELIKASLVKTELPAAIQDVARRLRAWKEFGELAREYSKNAPPLSDYAISREGIYDYELERNS